MRRAVKLVLFGLPNTEATGYSNRAVGVCVTSIIDGSGGWGLDGRTGQHIVVLGSLDVKSEGGLVRRGASLKGQQHRNKQTNKKEA